MEDSETMPCPYCDDKSRECKHVLALFDSNFGDVYGGYLEKDNTAINELEKALSDLLNQGLNIKLGDDPLSNIWEDAKADYSAVEVNGEKIMETYVGLTTYMQYIEEFGLEYDAEVFVLEEIDEMPGMSSQTKICYAKDPKYTLDQINKEIIDSIRIAYSNKKKKK